MSRRNASAQLAALPLMVAAGASTAAEKKSRPATLCRFSFSEKPSL